MSLTRVIGVCLIGTDWLALRGVLKDVPFSDGDGACPTTLKYVNFEWRKTAATLTSTEADQVDAAWTMLSDYLTAEEACADLRTAHYFHLTLGAGGVVQNVSAYVFGPVVAGRTRELWAPNWSKQRSTDSPGIPAFSTQDTTNLDTVVAMLSDYLTAEEPL